MIKPLVAGNWKMHGNTATASNLAAQKSHRQIITAQAPICICKSCIADVAGASAPGPQSIGPYLGYAVNQVHTLGDVTTYVLQKEYLFTYVKCREAGVWVLSLMITRNKKHANSKSRVYQKKPMWPSS